MENIKWNPTIVETETKDGYVFTEPHDKILQIASANLNDFNSRIYAKAVIKYDEIKRSFSLINHVDSVRMRYLSTQFINNLNRLISLVRRPDFDQRFILTEYISRIEKELSELQKEIRGAERLKKDKLTEPEKLAYLNTINQLIKLYKDSYPIGALTESSKIVECKEAINELCEDLSKEIN